MNPKFMASLLKQIRSVLHASDRLYFRGVHSDLSNRDLQQLLSMSQAVIARLGTADPTHTKHAQEILGSGVADSYILDRLLGVIKSLKISVEKGYLENIEELIHGEVFDDFVEMAEHLLAEGYKDAAAVICGSTLESHLRNLCLRNKIPTVLSTNKGDRPKKADQMNNHLASTGVYEKLDQKSVTTWLDLRNKAAHGEYDKYTKEQVRLMLTGVRDFVARHPA